MALASGFQLREQGASGQGNAFAGVSAGGEDISSMFFNPASLARYSGTQLQLGGTFIKPVAEFSDGSAHRSAALAGSPFYAVSGQPSHGNAAKSAVTPNLYAMWSLNPDLRLGFSVNVPYGLTTEYGNDWMGRYHGTKSHLETLDFTPTVAYRLNSQWSFGLAAVARQAKAELGSALDLGAMAAANLPPSVWGSNLGPGRNDGFVTIKGDAWGYGAKAGVLFEPTRDFRMGFGYQSEIKIKLKGDATFTRSASLATALTALGPTAAPILAGINGATTDGPVRAELPLPAVYSLGFQYDLTRTFALQGEVALTQWSSFKELRVSFSNPTPQQKDSITEEKWKDATFVSVGATCKPGDGWTYRAGLAFDQCPVKDEYRTPRIPDADRTWISAGVGYQVNRNLGLDLGYSHIFAKESRLALRNGTSASDPNYGRGDLYGTYKNRIDIVSLQARWTF
jgi:long-chain fatty acid transport protein